MISQCSVFICAVVHANSTVFCYICWWVVLILNMICKCCIFLPVLWLHTLVLNGDSLRCTMAIIWDFCSLYHLNITGAFFKKNSYHWGIVTCEVALRFGALYLSISFAILMSFCQKNIGCLAPSVFLLGFFAFGPALSLGFKFSLAPLELYWCMVFCSFSYAI